MNDQFATMIRKMENEVTALKTAHERGLGTVDFYSKTATLSTTYDSLGYVDIHIRATVASGELTPAFCQLQLTVENLKTMTLVESTQSGSTLTWYYLGFGTEGASANTNVRVISASKLSTLTVGTS